MKRLRRYVQYISAAAASSYWKSFAGIGIYDGGIKQLCIPVLHCYACPLSVFACPLGSLQYFIMTGQFPFYVFGILLAGGVILGRMTCGWLCPFGLLQDLMYKLGKIKHSIPQFLHNIKYIILVFAVIILPFYTHKPWFCLVCPAGELTGGIPFLVFDPSVRSLLFDPTTNVFSGWATVLKASILFFFLNIMTVTKRPFCRILCPLGAMLSFFNRLSAFKLTLDNDQNCRDCNCCSLMCPMDLDVPKKLDSNECIRCLNCTTCRKINIKFLDNKVDIKLHKVGRKKSALS